LNSFKKNKATQILNTQGGAGASGGNSGAGKSGTSKISETGTPDHIEKSY